MRRLRQVMVTLAQVCFQASYLRVDDLQWIDWHICRKSLHSPLLQSLRARPCSGVHIIIIQIIVTIITFSLKRKGKINYSFKGSHLPLSGIWPTAPPSALLGHLTLSYSSPPCAVCWWLWVLGDHRGPDGGKRGMIQRVKSVQPFWCSSGSEFWQEPKFKNE